MVFKRVKQWLGIEGIKLEIVIPEEVHLSDGELRGQIRFTTMNTQRINYIKVMLIEKYSRGRRKGKITDEYLLGEVEIDDGFMVYPDEPKLIEFDLDFKLLKSNMDYRADRGGVFGGMAKVMKWAKGVKSEYRVEAEAKVAGTALSPFDKKIVNFKF